MFRPKRFALSRNFLQYPGVIYKQASMTPKKKPVIILFGWLGSSEKNLAKYTQMYNKHGYDTLSYIPPTFNTMFPWSEKSISKRVKGDIESLLSEQGYGPHEKVIAHLFSNNGYIHFCFLLRLLRQENDSLLLNRFQASIIDSAPCKLYPDVVARGFVGAFVPIKDPKEKLEHKIFTPLFENIYRLLLRYLPTYKSRINDISNLMDQTVLPSPQLMLYSKGDKMIYSQDIDAHIDHIQKTQPNQKVIIKKFEDSPHVSHYRYHPDEYEEVVFNFIEKINGNTTQ